MFNHLKTLDNAVYSQSLIIRVDAGILVRNLFPSMFKLPSCLRALKKKSLFTQTFLLKKIVKNEHSLFIFIVFSKIVHPFIFIIGFWSFFGQLGQLKLPFRQKFCAQNFCLKSMARFIAALFRKIINFHAKAQSRFQSIDRDARPCVSTWHRSAEAPKREIGFRSNLSLKIIIYIYVFIYIS